MVTAMIVATVIAWMFATGQFVRSFASIALALLWMLLTGLWWAFRAHGRRLARLGILALVVIVLVTAFKLLLRYDGSADGSALPRFAWKWSRSSAVGAPASVKSTPADLSHLPSGLADFPRFMGSLGDGTVPAVAFDTDWKAHPPREVWRVPVGLGWSGFAVAGRRAITQEQRGEMECATCYDVADGSLLWSHEDKARFSEQMGGDGPRATPTIDAQNKAVFTMGATGILNCLDLETGSLKWTRDILSANHAKNLMWGKSCSPLLHGAHVIVTGGMSAPTVIALDRVSGKMAWRSGDDGACYSSPVVMTIAGQEQIVSVNDTSVTAHDPAAGTVLWSFAWPGTMPKSSQPISAGPDRILVSSSYGMKSHLLEIKARKAGGLSVTPVWTGASPRTKFSSASIVDGFAYGLDEGTLSCVDLRNGDRRWRDGRYGYGQHVLVNRLMLFQCEPGFLALVKPNSDRLEEIARIPALNSMTWNPPALAGRWLLVRNDKEAVCFELPEKR